MNVNDYIEVYAVYCITEQTDDVDYNKQLIMVTNTEKEAIEYLSEYVKKYPLTDYKYLDYDSFLIPSKWFSKEIKNN